MRIKKCKECGNILNNGFEFCQNCGKEVKSNNKKTLIIIIFFLIFGLLVFLFLSKFAFKNEKKVDNKLHVLSRLEQKAEDRSSDWNKYNEDKIDEEHPEKNIVISQKVIDDWGNIVVLSKNYNKKWYNIYAKIIFKDSSNKVIKEQTEFNSCIPSQDCISIFSSTYIPKEYASYDVSYEFTYEDKYKSKYNVNDIKLKPSDDGKNISVKVTNNSGENKYSPSICVAYFYDDELLRAECLFSIGLESKNTDNLKFRNYYFSKKYKGLNFNNYKVFVNEL